MSIAAGFVAALLLLAGALHIFLRASPAAIASAVSLAGPIVLGLFGGVMMLLGRAGIGGMALSLAFAWFMRSQRRRKATPSPGGRSTVRTAAIEMELDHDSGALEGTVLAGRHEGRRLAQLGRADLFALRLELAGDGESLQLLEAYLDGRFPGWRQHADADVGDRQGTAPGSGPMTQQEAYQILGLEAGASAADIRKAHRRLMQRLHPDLGGSSFLAARINEAKDVLLNAHG